MWKSPVRGGNVRTCTGLRGDVAEHPQGPRRFHPLQVGRAPPGEFGATFNTRLDGLDGVRGLDGVLVGFLLWKFASLDLFFGRQ